MLRQDVPPTSRTDRLPRVAATRVIEIRTEIPGPRSREILERERRAVARPLIVHEPIVADRARGSTITDVDGNTFVDFVGGVGVANVGHNHPRSSRRSPSRPIGSCTPTSRSCRTRATSSSPSGWVRSLRSAARRAARSSTRAPRRSRTPSSSHALHEAPGRHRVRGRVPRTHVARADDDVEDVPVQEGARAVRARGLSRAVPERVSRPGCGRTRSTALETALHDARVRRITSRRSSSSPSRAKAASSRRRPSSSRACADLRRARHRARGGRGADRASAERPGCSRWSTSTSSPT